MSGFMNVLKTFYKKLFYMDVRRHSIKKAGDIFSPQLYISSDYIDWQLLSFFFLVEMPFHSL